MTTVSPPIEIERPAPFYPRPILVFAGSPPSACVIVTYSVED